MTPPDPQQQQQLGQAIGSARAAYRDTTRLIRLLAVLGQPAAPEELLDQTLAVLSEVFFAEVTVVAHRLGDRLVVEGACGLPESDPAFGDGWPVAVEAAWALSTGRPAARSAELDLSALPASVSRLGIRSAAWLPLTPATHPAGTGTEDLLMLFRSRADPFTTSDLQVLSSVAGRLRLAVDERERSVVIEQLARYGHRLARHLELAPLLDEAVDLLRQLTGADQAWLVTVTGDQAQLAAHRGLTGADLRGWPRPVGPVDRRGPAVRPRPPAIGTGSGDDGLAAVGPAEATAATLASAAPGTLLEVPVERDGALTAVLFAARERHRPFSKDVPETTAIFANYLAVAMVNAGLYRTLRARATQDPLTGLANRTLVVQELEAELNRPATAGAAAAPVGLLFCDLDRFKVVNDLLGHEAGDELLQQVAARLRASIRPTDLLARFGGDEFVVILDRVRDLAEVSDAGQRLARQLDHELTIRGQRVRVSASVGGVLGVPGHHTASAMLRDADAAMYAAKERGLGQVEVFDEAASHRALDRLELRSELAHALDRDQLRLLYQPIISLETGQVQAFEALLRWDHPRHGTVSPEVFVPLAEDSGDMVAIGQWVLEQACQQLATWQHDPAGRRVAVSVNVSASQLRHERLVAQTLATIHAAGVSPSDVVLEVTEHSYLRQDVTATATALRRAGVQFALDDFGTAYSSLSYLRRIPIRFLKIDQSLVAGVTRRDTDLSIVRAILAIAESLDLATVAEGIETESQLTTLRRLGCQLGQGNLFAPPVPPAAATKLLGAPVPAVAMAD